MLNIHTVIFMFGIKGVVFVLTKIVCLTFRNCIEYGIKEYFNYIQEKERGREREKEREITFASATLRLYILKIYVVR